MKKIIITMMLCVMTLAASAQIKTIDVKGDLRGDFGLGVGITAGIFDKIDISPRVNYYFTKGDVTCYTIEADFHYNFDVAPQFNVYPIAGLVYYYAGAKNFDSVNKLGVNLGVGGQYEITNKIAAFVEAKYQWVDGADDTYFSLGVNIGI